MTTELLPTPAEAATQLDQLKGTATWRDAFLKGNGPEVAQYKRLTEISTQSSDRDADMAVAGVVPLHDGALQDSSARLLADHAAGLREQGIPDAAIRQAISGQPVAAEEHAAAQRTKDRLMRDQEFTKLYLAGNGPQKEQMGLLNIVLMSPIKGAA